MAYSSLPLIYVVILWLRQSEKSSQPWFPRLISPLISFPKNAPLAGRAPHRTESPEETGGVSPSMAPEKHGDIWYMYIKKVWKNGYEWCCYYVCYVFGSIMLQKGTTSHSIRNSHLPDSVFRLAHGQGCQLGNYLEVIQFGPLVSQLVKLGVLDPWGPGGSKDQKIGSVWLLEMCRLHYTNIYIYTYIHIYIHIYIYIHMYIYKYVN